MGCAPEAGSLMIFRVGYSDFFGTGLLGLWQKNKAKGIALGLWFCFALLFDGIVMVVLLYFRNYPVKG